MKVFKAIITMLVNVIILTKVRYIVIFSISLLRIKCCPEGNEDAKKLNEYDINNGTGLTIARLICEDDLPINTNLEKLINGNIEYILISKLKC